MSKELQIRNSTIIQHYKLYFLEARLKVYIREILKN